MKFKAGQIVDIDTAGNSKVKDVGWTGRGVIVGQHRDNVQIVKIMTIFVPHQHYPQKLWIGKTHHIHNCWLTRTNGLQVAIIKAKACSK